MNPFLYTFDNKRYHTLNYYYKNKYKRKVAKLTLDAHFSCPNKDQGQPCIYCRESFNPLSLDEQYHEQVKIIKNKWSDAVYIAYLGYSTNTYSDLKTLRKIYELVLSKENVMGLTIGTRPDCLSNEIVKYLKELNEKTNLTVELGLQTIHDKTLKLIKRGHDLNCFEKAVENLRKNNIEVVVHIINGLPGESKKMMLETITYLNTLDIQGLKIHMLHILKDTELETYYQKKKFKLLSKKEYISLVCDQLERLNPKIVIHRLTGDPDTKNLIEPKWIVKKVDVLNGIDKELFERNSYQGKKSEI